MADEILVSWRDRWSMGSGMIARRTLGPSRYAPALSSQTIRPNAAKGRSQIRLRTIQLSVGRSQSRTQLRTIQRSADLRARDLPFGATDERSAPNLFDRCR